MPKTDIESIIDVISIIRNQVTADTDIVWTSYDDFKEIITDIDKVLERLRTGDTTVLDSFKIFFAPTGTFQEISISNGWSGQFSGLAESFDYHYKNLKKHKSFG